MEYYKLMRDTDHYRDVKNTMDKTDLWADVIKSLESFLGISPIHMHEFPDDLSISMDHLDEENTEKALVYFTKSGKLRKTKKGKPQELREYYESLIEDYGLKGYMTMRMIAFVYRTMKSAGSDQTYEWFWWKDDMYWKMNFKRDVTTTLEPITSEEYHTKYMEFEKANEKEEKEEHDRR
jgi:hypothetical protein